MTDFPVSSAGHRLRARAWSAARSASVSPPAPSAADPPMRRKIAPLVPRVPVEERQHGRCPRFDGDRTEGVWPTIGLSVQLPVSDDTRCDLARHRVSATMRRMISRSSRLEDPRHERYLFPTGIEITSPAVRLLLLVPARQVALQAFGTQRDRARVPIDAVRGEFVLVLARREGLHGLLLEFILRVWSMFIALRRRPASGA